MHASLAFVLSLAAAAVAAPSALVTRKSAPAGCLTVGTGGKYSTVQSAVDALSTSSTSEQCIYIAKGTYKEQVYIQKLKSALTIYGETSDTSSYESNSVTITQGRSQDNSKNNDLTATLRAHTANLKVYNINLVNTRGQGSQALALSAYNGKQGYYACQFKGYQDTVLAQVGKQLYAKSYIEGATDFIFGQNATAWFDGCTIGVLKADKGYITANGRADPSNPSYYVINDSHIAAAPDNTVKDGAYYLGRPWGAYARVVFQNSDLSSVINPAGWSIWNKGDEKTSNVLFGEYSNKGDGTKGTRASFSKKLTSGISIDSILGSDYTDWVDASYF
ncbi:carbohydrate esterase family 8 protein [Plenodomus tracheiphilus IPT5]|uniref:Pectinesterase n=1 Tax=Plenodomus tracheiphilus IPT5 TaxID=1408161 RepID=A0A6A7AUV6_9PLEO|nr:carbohydrate esterase family 8 protein [Plenodomus tracheiphilus IPT5]